MDTDLMFWAAASQPGIPYCQDWEWKQGDEQSGRQEAISPPPPTLQPKWEWHGSEKTAKVSCRALMLLPIDSDKEPPDQPSAVLFPGLA